MVRNLMMIFGLTLAVAAFGCDSDSGNPAGSGGSGGSGGGGGEGGAAGEGGAGGGAGGAPGGGIAPACDNADDIAAGDPDVTACATAAAISNPEYCDPDSSGLATCLADAGNTQSAECLDCWADLSCCTLGECSVLVGGPCAGAPEPGDPCDLCVTEKCQPAFAACGAAQ